MAKSKSTKYLDKDHPIYNEGFKVSSQNKSLKNYIKAREKAENKERTPRRCIHSVALSWRRAQGLLAA